MSAGIAPSVVPPDQHRELVRHMRNVLAVVRALVRRAALAENESDEHRARLEGRINAFARAQAGLLHDLRRGADLENLVRVQLVLFGVAPDADVAIGGPPVRLDAQATGLVALLLHELALGTIDDSGRPTSISWHVDDEGTLRLEWIDTAVGQRNTEWIKGAIRYELGGVLTDEGPRCLLVLPARYVIATA